MTVPAFSPTKLPSPLQFGAWIEDWEGAHGGTWALGPAHEGPSPTSPATRSMTFVGTTSSPNSDIDKSLGNTTKPMSATT